MTDSSPGTLAAIEVDEFLPHPVATVWRALITPSLLAMWLMENDFEPIVGHRFRMRGIPVPAVGFSGLVASEVLEIVPERRLVISWADANAGNALASVVTFSLVPEGSGTRLLLRHDGFDASDPTQVVAHRIMSSGWRSQVLSRLVSVLASPPPQVCI
jgi:uncharacterized protein YndB with AHSA1/START domain